MADCDKLITAGVPKICADIVAAIGADKDLILVNYADYDKALTQASGNIEATDTNSNVDGLTTIFLKSGAVQYTFEGTDYSVQPSSTPELKDDGNAWYLHSLLFTAYSKTSATRKVIEDLGSGKVIAITQDRSTGFYELFGSEQGLKLSSLERAYVGAQNSNFYQVTLQTPDIAVIRESTVGELAGAINTAI